MPFYYIILIVVASLMLIAGITFLIICGVSTSKKKKINQEALEYYQKIILAVGGIDNIIDVNAQTSRLSLVLKDYNKVNKDLLEGVGIVRSNQKITLVIGSMAKEYANKIQLTMKQ